MREHWYHPGTDGAWLTVAAGEALLAVDSAATIAIPDLWSALPNGFQSVLDVLTSRGISATPSFALLAWSGTGELRAIVRGPARLTVSSGDREQLLDGTGVSTWTEVIFAASQEFELALPGVASGSELPLAAGAAMAVRVTSTPAGSGPIPQRQAAGESVSENTVVAMESPVEKTVTVPDDDYDLFGETLHRGVTEAAVADAAEGHVEAPAEPGPMAGDHDGMTIMAGDLRRMRKERKASVASAEAGPDQPDAVPTLRLELADGTSESLDQMVIVGRSPSASKVSGGAIPRLLTIPGDKDISRNHAQFAVEGGTVVVTDLHSRNGTQIVMPGRAPQQLRQGEPTAVIVGTVVDLGGGVTLTVREGE